MTTTYIKVEPCSTRLGNWMFQYAAAKCAASDDAISFVIGGDQDIEAVCKYACLWPDATYVREAPEGSAVRIGLFQDKKHVDRAKCRLLYACPEEMRRQLFEKYEDLLKNDDLVSIHVRRGDYLQLPHRHPFVGTHYLREAVEHFKGHEFLVFSDDMAWCKRFFKGPQFHFAEGNAVLADLFLMTYCRGGHICSNSTFSWWGAFLGEGKTVFPSMWFGPAIRGEDWQGLYFEGCEVVENGYSPGLWLKARLCMVKNACGDILRKIGLR